MTGPWEDYQQQPVADPNGPWNDYAASSNSPKLSSPAPKPYDSDQGPDKDLPVFLRRDNAFNRLGNLLESGATFGLNTEVRPVANYLAATARRAFGLDAPSSIADLITDKQPQSPSDAYHAAKQEELAKRDVARQEYGILPEILAGFGSATPIKGAPVPNSLAGQFRQGLPLAVGMGGAAGLTSSDGTVGERFQNALLGGALGVAGQGIGTGLGYGIGKLSGYAGRAIADAKNPEQAAYRNIAEGVEDAGVNTGDIRDVIAPDAKRATSDQQVSEIVRRSQSGQSQKQIAKEMGLSQGVVADRIQQFADNTRTPLNVIDAVKLIKRQQGEQGGDTALTGLATTAAGLDKAAAGIAAGRLVQRQVEQPGRIADHLERLTSGPSFDDTLGVISDTLGQKSREAYGQAFENALPFDLAPIIRQYRGIEHESAGELKSGLSNAIDLFYKPGMVEAGEAGAPSAALSNAADTANLDVPPGMMPGSTQQAEGATRFTKFAEPIDDLQRFQNARQALDQQIARSMQDGRPTPLTRRLTQFRQAITAEVEKANPDFAAANAQFSGAKDAQKIIETAQKATLRAGGKQRADLDYFNSLTPEQKDLYRTAYKQKLTDDALNTTRGGSTSTRAYTSESAQNFIRQIFEKKEAERLLSDINKENVTSETLKDVLMGSRTAPLAKSMEDLAENAHMVGDLVTANVPGFVRRVGRRVASGISANQARKILDITTNTDRGKILNFLDNIDAASRYNALANTRVQGRSNYLAPRLGAAARNALVDYQMR